MKHSIAGSDLPLTGQIIVTILVVAIVVAIIAPVAWAFLSTNKQEV
jgi:hypothetical protein